MPQQFVLDLIDIADENASQTAAQILVGSIVQDNVVKKQVGKDFLDKCLRNLQSQKASPEIKFYTLYIFKFLESRQKNVVKIFSLLSGHPLFAHLVELAQKVDPRKSMSEKGKSYFPSNKELGNKFMRLLLQSIKNWAQRFPHNNVKEPTKYKKAYSKLLEQKVVFPDSYQFYGGGNQRQEQKTPGNPQKLQKNPSKQNKAQSKVQSKAQTKVQSKPQKQKTTPGSSSQQQQKQLQSQIRYLYNKIQLFIGDLEDQNNQNPDEIIKLIKRNHSYFQKQQKKLQNPNIGNIQDQKVVGLLFKISQFFAAQKKTYQQEISGNDDLKMYIDTILMQFDSIFTDDQPNKNSIGRKSQKKSKLVSSQTQIQAPQLALKVQKQKVSQPNREDKKKNDEQSRQNQKSSKIKSKMREQQQEQESRYKNKGRENNIDIKDKALRSFFDSHLDKPANRSLSGFRAIKESLEKQKKQLKGNGLRGKSPHNASNLSKSKFDASTVSKIKTNSIFAKPPNANVNPKKYDGSILTSNPQLQCVLYSLKREQGSRRFKISNMKNRSLLYESQHLQIGCKSQPLYDQVEGQDASEIIQFQLFIGNKASKQIRNLQITFQGDQRSLVYSNPEKIEQTINPGQQRKMDVVVIPKHQIYSMVNMKISYQYQGSNIQTGCILPSSILKFTSFQKADTRTLRDYENRANVAYQSQKFNLSHYFPPRKLSHYIEQLTQLTEYAQFAQNGSESDFVLGSFIHIKDTFSGMLKINIRPDLGVVIQLKSNDDKQDAQKEFRLFVQTLQFILKQTR